MKKQTLLLVTILTLANSVLAGCECNVRFKSDSDTAMVTAEQSERDPKELFWDVADIIILTKEDLFYLVYPDQQEHDTLNTFDTIAGAKAHARQVVQVHNDKLIEDLKAKRKLRGRGLWILPKGFSEYKPCECCEKHIVHTWNTSGNLDVGMSGSIKAPDKFSLGSTLENTYSESTVMHLMGGSSRGTGRRGETTPTTLEITGGSTTGSRSFIKTNIVNSASQATWKITPEGRFQ